jgi:hypothetical protein
MTTRKANAKDKDEMRGFLHCAAHDETVSVSGRNDDFIVGLEEGKDNNRSPSELLLAWKTAKTTAYLLRKLHQGR